MATAEPRTVLRRSQSGRKATVLAVPIRHPTPDLQTLQGAYTRNVANLERSAEEMSSNGSDLGEQIRRLSRRNSAQSSHNGRGVGGVIERVGSGRSNRSASYGPGNGGRWGGYSPSAYVTSPGGSGSGSWSHASLSRVQSGSKSSRLAHVTEPMMEGRPLDSPLRTTFSVHEEEDDHRVPPGEERQRDASQSSFAQRYDEIAGQIEQSLENVPPSPTKYATQVHRDQALNNLETGGASTPPDRPRSTDTYREAQIAFKDFDGVHFSPDSDEFVELDEAGNEIRRVSARSVSGGLSMVAASMLRAAHERPISQAPPPPGENMVYYPAPVPRMLNLPKRLSQLPAANVQAQRRSQVLGTVPDHVRDGAPWLSQNTIGEGGVVRQDHRRSTSGSSGALGRGFLNERMSANLNNLPAQLRANMFFEHQPVQHDVRVKSESAVATLDSILDASATAPVHAFTDHPYVGDVRDSTYAPERAARRSTATLGTGGSPEQAKAKKRRSSSIGALLKRTTSSDALTDKLKKRNSRASILTDFNEGGNKLRKRQSQLSLGTQLDADNAPPVETPATDLTDLELDQGLVASAQNRDVTVDHRASQVPTIMSSGYRLDDADQIEDDFREAETREDIEPEEEGEPIFVQPSTLLAELQVRKAQLKARTKTAATAFPQGMHSTLLELDAVEEINKRKRQHQRIALAWEDPHQRALEEDMDRGDEDVPLGMLFPGKDGANKARAMGDGRDFERPLGLMERRALEDNEPLSRRMRRIRGDGPMTGREMNASQMDLAGDVGEEEVEDEHAGETLGQRMRRMKTKTALDDAIAEVVDPDATQQEGSRPQSRLVEDVMSRFGDLDVKDNNAHLAAPSPSPNPSDEGETLGQRRARLQREREASGGSLPAATTTTPARPALHTSNSLANLLAANPIGQRGVSKSYAPTAGTLLHANEQMQAKHRSQLNSTNANSSTFALDRPLVDGKPQTLQQGASYTGLLGGPGINSRAPVGGYGGGAFNNGAGGIVSSPPVQSPATMPGTGYFASPTAGASAFGFAHPAGMAAYNPYAQQQAHAQYQQQQMFAQQQQYLQQQAMLQASRGGMAGFSNAYMNGGGTYAAFAQNQGVGGGMMASAATGGVGGFGGGMAGGMGMAEEELNPHQRAAIDRWRMSVAGQ